MADVNRAASLAKNFQKHAGRAKELFRQNLGKADRTTDEEIDEYAKNFTKQQCATLRLTKEIKNYQNSVKALQVASKALTDVICDIYEPNWIDFDKVQVQAEALEKKFEDYHETVEEQVIKPLLAYSEQFPDMQQKVLKRKRKLLDYDNCRHIIQNLEQNPKKKEESKINKAREQLAEKRNLYEVINSELLQELPALHDSRISFLASNLQCLFIAEATFHNEISKIFGDLNDAVEALAAENEKGVYSSKKLVQQSNLAMAVWEPPQETGGIEANRSSSSEYLSSEALACHENVIDSSTSISHEECTGQEADIEVSNLVKNNAAGEMELPSSLEEKCKIELPSGVFYQVEATFQYTAEDADELSFEPGDIINVTDFDDPDQKEDGWLMGYKDGSMEKGLFPVNFTKHI